MISSCYRERRIKVRTKTVTITAIAILYSTGILIMLVMLVMLVMSTVYGGFDMTLPGLPIHRFLS